MTNMTYEELDSISSLDGITEVLRRLEWPSVLAIPPDIFVKWATLGQYAEYDANNRAMSLAVGPTKIFPGTSGESLDLSKLKPRTDLPPEFRILTIDQVAGICHEANRGYCACHGDYSQLSWSDSPNWLRQSVIDGVLFNLNHFLNYGHPAEPGDSHKRWMARKVAEGWKYGPVKDEESRSHPCLMPFENLPVEQQVKDRLFTAIVTALAPFM